MRWWFLSLLVAASACTDDRDPDGLDTDGDGDTATTAGDCGDWTAVGFSDETHTKAGDLAYDLLFDDEAVQRVDIVICPDDWADMQDDLDALWATSDGRPGSFPDGTPTYVPVLVSYGDQTWPWVGMRFKGNSTLWGAYSGGNGKLPFRLNFDRYEDDYVEIDNQRFFGFKELKFGSNYNDDSFIADKMASDTFRDAGIPAAKGAFTRVYVDIGDGPEYWGLYTMFEDPSHSLLDDWFGDDDGNLYEGDGDAATLGWFDADSFEAKTNEDETDWSDVQALIDALDGSTSGSTFRTELEAALDVDSYLRALAVNQIIGNWDSYGMMTHNYYLYGDPGIDGRLVYIPWDFNESYEHGSGRRGALSVDLGEVSGEWPLIRRTMDDEVYRGIYLDELASVMDGPLDVDVQLERAEAYHDLIEPYVVGAEGEQAGFSHLRSEDAFDRSVDALLDAVEDGRSQAEALLR